MSFIGELVCFDYKSSEWAVFKCELNQFFIVNDVEDAKKSAVLLTHLTEDSRSLLRDLAYPDTLEECVFTQLVSLLDGHFKPRKCSFAERAKFYEAVKQPDETLADWVARLRGIATYCGFGTALEQILTDRFVLGLDAGVVRDELFEEDAVNLKLTEALDVAQRAESAWKAKSMRTTVDAVSTEADPIQRATHKNKSGGVGGSRKEGRTSASSDRSSRVPKCVVCGRKHLGKCPVEEYRCNKCGLTVSTVHNIETESESDVRCCEKCENLNKSTFDMDDFKRCYSTQDESVSVPYFWEKFDPEHYSIWFAEYKYPHELAKVFMSCNLITGLFQRLDKMRKQMFASVCLFGADDDSTISGVWVWRGQQLIFTLSPDWQDSGYESYKWTKLDPTNVRTKKLVKDYFSWSGADAQGRPFNQGKIFK